MPPDEVWNQAPIVGLIVLVIAALGGGLFIAVRWAWDQVKTAIKEDREWRDAQNEKRELAAAAQNKAWQDAIEKMSTRWELQDKQRENTLSAIAGATNRMLEKLDAHDQHARSISEAVNNLAPKVEAALEKTTPRSNRKST